MTIESLRSGLRITDLTDDGHLFSRLYIFYTRREATALFKQELAEVNNKSN